tara:strand:+ start:1831 stop:2235 length:405 start_codon:yes stop_codon:yes gene_type:complete
MGVSAMIFCLQLASSTARATMDLKCELHVLSAGGERAPNKSAGSRGCNGVEEAVVFLSMSAVPEVPEVPDAMVFVRWRSVVVLDAGDVVVVEVDGVSFVRDTVRGVITHVLGFTTTLQLGCATRSVAGRNAVPT